MKVSRCDLVTGLLIYVAPFFVVFPALADEVRFDASYLNGELKYMERGQLYFDTSATNTFPIEWVKVEGLSSNQQLEIELQDGTLRYGKLMASQESGKVLLVDNSDQSTDTLLTQIVRITPIENQFLARFDGSVALGFNITKANDYQQFNLGIDLEYLTKKYVSDIGASVMKTESADTAPSNQSRLQVRTLRRLENRWTTGGLLQLESNEDLGIDLRSSIGATVGRRIVQTNERKFTLDGGILYTREAVASSSDEESSIEGFLTVQYEMFRYHSPKLDLSTALAIIPSFSESGRVRANLSVTMKWEFLEDTYWTLSLYDSYDNKPPGDDASTNDYSIMTGIAWDI